MAPSPQPTPSPGPSFIIPVRPGVRPPRPELQAGEPAPDASPGPAGRATRADAGWVAKSRHRSVVPERREPARSRRAATGPWLAAGATAAFTLVLAALVALLSGTAQSVIDQAGLLDPAERDQIAEYHRRLLESSDIDYRVVTTAPADNLERAGRRLLDRLAVGRASLADRGLLLLIEPAAGQVRLETSPELEAMLGAGFIAYLEQQQMAPFFAEDRVADGIIATSELILARAQQAAAGFAFDLAAAESYAQIDETGVALAAPLAGGEVEAGTTPTETVDAYLAALAARRTGPDLPLYSDATRALGIQPALTRAQMAELASSYRDCAGRETWIGGPDNAQAVVRYNAEQRQCAPWFLVHEDGGWRLDLAASQRALAFDEQRQWRLAERAAAGYAFGFFDWRFDDQGVPLVSS